MLDLRRQHLTRRRGADFEVRDQQDKGQLWADLESGRDSATRHRESAEGCGRGIVGVALEPGAEFEKLMPCQG